MKNNMITLSQFCVLSFLASLSALLFIDNKASVLMIVLFASALLFDIAVLFWYKGAISRLLKPLSAIYLSFFCAVICLEFCKYMFNDLGYGSKVVLIILILVFSYFSAAKGFEPLARASVIISVFVTAALLFIAVSSFGKIRFNFELNTLNSSVVPFLLLLPSALYILNYDNIIKKNKFMIPIYSFVILLTVFFFYLLPKNDVALSIFKGADGVLLAVLSVAVIYFISGSAVSIFKDFKHKFIANSLFLSLILVVSVISACFL